ncbi:prepilin-type N-terminal cleavage/methylation domain-containing protein [Paraglaciecola aquimarina]|uniref:Prepilin-type N-terminal cleavage/methylation domain-containing protein n=1 Tax=Paraglaciecola algarum TaxID=3050085 RepID=A0ABS9D6E2_9ALTE|nr:prepilin-type N-terminal cleavage/methylation domain-containing protein [Paraglaciecola sp. G1-23]MCF2948441.1 prepilin-type N-terminal cleavage/methylation domain-containing protein [Paraglaciecola sp. G1-23]
MSKSNSGMTLIEVLIASVILFIAIASVSVVSRTNTLYKQRLELAVVESASIDFIMDEISFYLEFSSETSGQVITENIEYDWEAVLVTKKAIASSIELNVGEVVAERGFLYLYQVSFTHAATKKKTRRFDKVIWRPS